MASPVGTRDTGAGWGIRPRAGLEEKPMSCWRCGGLVFRPITNPMGAHLPDLPTCAHDGLPLTDAELADMRPVTSGTVEEAVGVNDE